MIHQPGVVRGVLARVCCDCVCMSTFHAAFSGNYWSLSGMKKHQSKIKSWWTTTNRQTWGHKQITNTHTQLKNAQEWKLCLCGNQNHNFNANSLPICSRDAPILNNAILGQYQHQCLKLNFSWEPIQIILACFIGGGEGHWVIYLPLWPRTSSNLPVQNWWNTTWSNGMGKY